MTTPSRTSSLLLASLASLAISTLCGASTANGEVIYRETFGTTSNNVGLSNVGWKAATGSLATDYSTTPVDTTNGAWLSSANGAPQNVANVNTGETSASEVTGLAQLSLLGSNNQLGLLYTNHYSFDLASYKDVTFSWYEGNVTTIARFRVALQIGGVWYASTSLFSNSVAVASAGKFATGAELETCSLVTDAASWTTLNFTPGSTLGVGSALSSALPTGTVTGFGIYADAPVGGAGGVRLDSFTIEGTAVPEPATGAALLIGSGLIGWWARNNRNFVTHENRS